MNLKDSFYRINSLNFTDNVLEAHLEIDSKHAIFGGHFPGNPVTPGVVQLELVKELLSEHYGQEVQLKSLANSKFLAVLNPLTHSQVSFKMTITEQEDATMRVAGVLATADTTFMKFSGTYFKG